MYKKLTPKKQRIYETGNTKDGGSIRKMAEKTRRTPSNVRMHIKQLRDYGYDYRIEGDKYWTWKVSTEVRKFIPVNIALLTASDTRVEADDKSGHALAERLTAAGHRLADKQIVPDDVYRIRAVVAGWIAEREIQAVITTGGTGVSGRDGSPEAVTPLLDKTLDGFGEMFRALSYDDIGTSTLQSRALAGVANGTYIFVLPGSTGACKLAWEKLISLQLDYRTRPCNLVEMMPRLLEQ